MTRFAFLYYFKKGDLYMAFLMSLLLFMFGAVNADTLPLDGLCQSENTGQPGLPKTTCYFPSCPTGVDCQPPSVDKTTAKIEYLEPMLQWKDTCPNRDISGQCWEVSVDLKAMVKADDPSGVTNVGVNVAMEVNAKKDFKKVWSKLLDKPNDQGLFEIDGTLLIHVPPGQRMELTVYELCAKDKLNNEGCFPPMSNLRFSPVLRTK